MNDSNHSHKFCPVPSCKEDLVDRIDDAKGELHKKINLVYRSKISKNGVYAVATIVTSIIVAVSSFMFISYARARDNRMEQIKENRSAIETVKNQQTEIKTKLDVELSYIKEALRRNQELSERVLGEIKRGNSYGDSGYSDN